MGLCKTEFSYEDLTPVQLPFINCINGFDTLLPWQVDLRMNPVQHIRAVCGRRGGKTTIAAHWALDRALEKPDQTVWIVGQTFMAVKRLYWRALIGVGNKKRIIPEALIATKILGELRIELINGSVIELKGADRPDTLLGAGLDAVVLDEYQSFKRDAWEVVLQPMLADSDGRSLIIGTPRGLSQLYDEWVKGDPTSVQKDPDYYSYKITTAQAGTIALNTLEKFKRQMSKEAYQQEFEASFTARQGLVYSSFDPVLNESLNELDIDRPLYIGVDFNVDPYCAVIGQFWGEDFHVIHEVHEKAFDTTRFARKINDEYSKWIGRIYVYPDPAGKARGTAQNGNSDHAILENGNMEVIVRNAHPRITDRVNAVNSRFHTYSGDRHLFVHNRCVMLKKCLGGQIYDDFGKPDKKMNLDHQPDSLGYMIEFEFPITAENNQQIIIM